MSRRIVPTVFAVAFLVSLPLEGALARSGGGGGGGGRGASDRGSDRGSISYSRPSNSSQQKLFDQARKDCSGARYPSGATPKMDYASSSYSCFETGSSRR